MIEQNNQIEGLNPDGYTKLGKAAELCSVSVATLRRRWSAGEFPQPVKPFGNDNYFRNSDLLEYNRRLEHETA